MTEGRHTPPGVPARERAINAGRSLARGAGVTRRAAPASRAARRGTVALAVSVADVVAAVRAAAVTAGRQTRERDGGLRRPAQTRAVRGVGLRHAAAEECFGHPADADVEDRRQ